jgi:hypothetical protein
MATDRPRSLIRVHSRIFAAFKFGPTTLRTRSVRRASGFVLTAQRLRIVSGWSPNRNPAKILPTPVKRR